MAMVSTLVGPKSERHLCLMRFNLTSARRQSATLALQWRRSSFVVGVITSLLLAFAVLPVFAENLTEPLPSLTHALDLVSSERMLEDIRTLSGAAYSGRQTGTPDDLASAEFVRRQFLELHKPHAFPHAASGEATGSPDYTRLQSTAIRTTRIGPDATLRIALTPDAPPDQIGTDYLPVLDSPSANLQAPVVFVGYGISDPDGGWDEYAGVDVRGKIVLFLRGKPERYPRQISHADKVHTAHAHGALGYLTATGPILNAYEARRGVTGRPSAYYGLVDPSRAIPGAWISTTRAMAVLRTAQLPSDDRLRTLQQNIHDGHPPQSMVTHTVVMMRWQSTEQDGLLHNVISILPGNDPTHSGEAIVIGAHRDHFGTQGGLLFAGADDNASGTAVLLEVARVLSASPVTPKRTIVLVSFSGEEQGLLGSKFYVSQPAVPLRSTTAMVNVDHAAVGNGRLTIGLTGIEKPAAQQAGERAGLTDRLDLFGFFPGGDHVPFKEAGIPTLTVVSGGTHPHFHQPTDTADTVNPEILTAVARYVLSIVWQLAETP
ncbi:MAG: M28 family peptidase [Nitrospira sp.]|nr:M28 family peptidase [Nitrospira sp.]